MDSDESSTVWLRCEHCCAYQGQERTLESAAAEKRWARGVLGGDTAPVPVLANAGVQEAGEDFGAVAEKHWVCDGPGVCLEATQRPCPYTCQAQREAEHVRLDRLANYI